MRIKGGCLLPSEALRVVRACRTFNKFAPARCPVGGFCAWRFYDLCAAHSPLRVDWSANLANNDPLLLITIQMDSPFTRAGPVTRVAGTEPAISSIVCRSPLHQLSCWCYEGK